MKHKKDFDMINFKLFIGKIKLMEEDFCKSQLRLTVATPMTSNPKRVIHDSALFSVGQVTSTASQQRMEAATIM